MRKSLWLAGCCLVLASSPAWAEGPGSGELSLDNITIGSCLATHVSVRYKLSSLLDEPLVNGSFSWEGPACKLPYSTVIWLRVETGDGGYGNVKLNPVVPEAGQGYGFNVSESPNWTMVLCAYQGTVRGKCHDALEARKIWLNGKVKSATFAW